MTQIIISMFTSSSDTSIRGLNQSRQCHRDCHVPGYSLYHSWRIVCRIDYLKSISGPPERTLGLKPSLRTTSPIRHTRIETISAFPYCTKIDIGKVNVECSAYRRFRIRRQQPDLAAIIIGRLKLRFNRR